MQVTVVCKKGRMQFQEDSIGESYAFRGYKDFLNGTKTCPCEENIGKLNHTKILNFSSPKETIKGMKLFTERKNLFAVRKNKDL